MGSILPSPRFRGAADWADGKIERDRGMGEKKGDVTTDGAFACTEKAFSGITPCSALDTDPREPSRIRSPRSKAERPAPQVAASS